MHIDPDEFRRHYDELNDEALLSINREEFSDLARQAYDEELRRRGLQARVPAFEILEIDEELVTVATFFFSGRGKGGANASTIRIHSLLPRE